jgi:EAL domain-containing protein (putative c-di-GMP-specific phosphodiesterase class I)
MDIGIAVNVSGMDLSSGYLPELLLTYLKRFGVAPERLILEITETAVMRDAVYSQEILNRLKDCGVGLAIDDFGTGYSSLSHLKRLPVDELKIDRSFVTTMATDGDDAVIVRSTIELAHNMGLHVVAEGVESDESLAMLRGFRCDTVQGYLISRPLTVEMVTLWLNQSTQQTPLGIASGGEGVT